jgi:glycosyltransferase involved in cell wall biosynthesis
VDTADSSTDTEEHDGGPLVVSLLTRGSPAAVTGGHLYHRRMAEAAAARGARIEFISTGVRDPFRAARGVVLVDSLTAWSVAPWMLTPRRPAGPVAAILHQPPGGIGNGALRTKLQRPLDQLFYHRCDLLIAASTALGHELVADFGLPAERVCVVEPGSDLPADAPPAGDLRRGRRIAVLCVANWLPNKGIIELLDAVAALSPDLLTLHLAGRTEADPRYGALVQARLNAPDLADRVVVHGLLDRRGVASLYGGADAFVLPSFVETYGTVFAEALTLGLPTVGWRSGNLPNLIEDGRQGCLVEPGDVAGLGDALRRLATDDDWRDTLATAARQRGTTLNSWDDTADAFFGALSRLRRHPD